MHKKASKRVRARAAPGSRELLELDDWLVLVGTERTGVDVCDPSEETDRGLLYSTTFTTYLVLATLPDGRRVETRRRYSDFEMLRESLTRRYPGCLVPALPGKAYTHGQARHIAVVVSSCRCSVLFVVGFSSCTMMRVRFFHRFVVCTFRPARDAAP